MIDYDRIIKTSEEITEHDLRRARVDDAVTDKLDENPLQSVMLILMDILETESKESQELKIGKRRRGVIRESEINPQQIISSSQSITPPYSQTRFPHSFETPDNKRKISETSFGTHSTESTPNKLIQAEAKVQSLQNKFVDIIIDKLWSGRIDIVWAQGRHKFMTYNEFLSLIFYR